MFHSIFGDGDNAMLSRFWRSPEGREITASAAPLAGAFTTFAVVPGLGLNAVPIVDDGVRGRFPFLHNRP
jgi:hypothetical protein